MRRLHLRHQSRPGRRPELLPGRRREPPLRPRRGPLPAHRLELPPARRPELLPERRLELPLRPRRGPLPGHRLEPPPGRRRGPLPGHRLELPLRPRRWQHCPDSTPRLDTGWDRHLDASSSRPDTESASYAEDAERFISTHPHDGVASGYSSSTSLFLGMTAGPETSRPIASPEYQAARLERPRTARRNSGGSGSPSPVRMRARFHHAAGSRYEAERVHAAEANSQKFSQSRVDRDQRMNQPPSKTP